MPSTKTKASSKVGKSSKKLVQDYDTGIDLSFYFVICDRMSVLEPMLVEFYSQLMKQLGFLDRLTLELNGREQTLTEELLDSVANSKEDVSEGVEFPLFRGGYIRLFEDGSVFQKIMYRVFEVLGEAKLMWIRWKTEYRLKNKSDPKLRTFYRFLDYSFIAQLPMNHYTAFQADTLLYCEWRCRHPNLIGFHLLILAWMLDVEELKSFAPPGIRGTPPMTEPLLRKFWPMSGLDRIRLASVHPEKRILSEQKKKTEELAGK